MRKPNLLDAKLNDPLWKRLQASDQDIQFAAKHEVLLEHDPKRAARISRCSERYPCYDPDCGKCGHPRAGSGARLRGVRPISKSSVGPRHYKTKARRRMAHLVPGLVPPEMSAVTINIAALDLRHPNLQHEFVKCMERFRDKLGKHCRRHAPGITLIGRIEVAVVLDSHRGVATLPQEAIIGSSGARYYALVHAHMVAVHSEHNRKNEFGDHETRKPTPSTDLITLLGSAFPNAEGQSSWRVNVCPIKDKIGVDGKNMHGAPGFAEYGDKRAILYLFEEENAWLAGRIAVLRKGLTKRRDAVSFNKKGLTAYAHRRDLVDGIINEAVKGNPSALDYLGDASWFFDDHDSEDTDIISATVRGDTSALDYLGDVFWFFNDHEREDID